MRPSRPTPSPRQLPPGPGPLESVRNDPLPPARRRGDPPQDNDLRGCPSTGFGRKNLTRPQGNSLRIRSGRGVHPDAPPAGRVASGEWRVERVAAAGGPGPRESRGTRRRPCRVAKRYSLATRHSPLATPSSGHCRGTSWGGVHCPAYPAARPRYTGCRDRRIAPPSSSGVLGRRHDCESSLTTPGRR